MLTLDRYACLSVCSTLPYVAPSLRQSSQTHRGVTGYTVPHSPRPSHHQHRTVVRSRANRRTRGFARWRETHRLDRNGERGECTHALRSHSKSPTTRRQSRTLTRPPPVCRTLDEHTSPTTEAADYILTASIRALYSTVQPSHSSAESAESTVDAEVAHRVDRATLQRRPATPPVDASTPYTGVEGGP
jgi:hypothetical protein